MNSGKISIKYFVLCVIAFSMILAQLGCTSFRKESNRSLSESELAEPPGNYQQGVNMHLTGQVQFSAPREKPIIEKTIEANMQEPCDMMVDSKGCVWFNSATKEKSSILSPVSLSVLTRLNPDGSISWEKKLKMGVIIIPALVCEGALIYHELTIGLKKVDDRFICIDLAGNTIWRTESLNGGVDVSRLSNDRFICDISDNNKGNYNIYSLSDGKLLGTLDLPKIDTSSELSTPVETPDKGWISFGEIIPHENQSTTESKYESNFETIGRYSSQFKEIWKINTESRYGIASPILTNDNALIFGGEKFLAKIDINDGNIIWKKTDGSKYQTCGIMSNNEIVIRYKDESGGYFLKVVDQKGNDAWKWKYPCNFELGEAVIIYNDNKILFGDKEGLNLIDKNGRIWGISSRELNVNPDDKSLYNWNLHPAPDDRVIASLWSWDKMSKIYFLKSPD